MPKKTSINTQTKWLNDYEDGVPEVNIACDAKCDLRTVKKGIEQARYARQMQIAKADLMKEALCQHHSQLIDVLKDILTAVTLPAPQLEVPLQVEITTPPSILAGGEVSWRNGERRMVLDVEKTLMFELLADHLDRDAIWENIKTWKETIIVHIEARMALKKLAYNLIKDKTGYPIIQHIDKAPDKGFIWPITVELFYDAALNHALLIKGGPDIAGALVASSADPYVRLEDGNHLLANVPGAQEGCKENLIKAFNELRKSDKMMAVFDTYDQVKTTTQKTRRVVEDISLFGMLPGSCRVCRRMGF